MHGTSPDESLFFLIDGIDRAPKFLAAAGLHLGKDECLVIPADKIDLPTSGSPEIPPENLPAESLEMTGGLILTPTTQGQMGLWIRSQRWAGRPVQNRGDDACKVHTLAA